MTFVFSAQSLLHISHAHRSYGMFFTNRWFFSEMVTA